MPEFYFQVEYLQIGGWPDQPQWLVQPVGQKGLVGIEKSTPRYFICY